MSQQPSICHWKSCSGPSGGSIVSAWQGHHCRARVCCRCRCWSSAAPAQLRPLPGSTASHRPNVFTLIRLCQAPHASQLLKWKDQLFGSHDGNVIPLPPIPPRSLPLTGNSEPCYHFRYLRHSPQFDVKDDGLFNIYMTMFILMIAINAGWGRWSTVLDRQMFVVSIVWWQWIQAMQCTFLPLVAAVLLAALENIEA